MTSAEMVTDFKLDGSTIQGLIKAINRYCGQLAEEYDFRKSWEYTETAPLPKYLRLFAYAVEGTNEGYYVHIACLVENESRHMSPLYRGLALAKTYSPDSAYALAREASRFLAAAAWN